MAEQNNHTMLRTDSQPCLSKAQLVDYVQGTMDKPAIRLVELHLVDCPLCADAIEAFYAHGLPAKWPEPVKKHIAFPKWYAAAASITAIGVSLSVMWGLQKEMAHKNETMANSADTLTIEPEHPQPSVLESSEFYQTPNPLVSASQKDAILSGNTTGAGVLANQDTFNATQLNPLAIQLAPGNSEPMQLNDENQDAALREEVVYDSVVSADLLSLQMVPKQNRAMNNQVKKEASRKVEVVEDEKTRADYASLYASGSYKASLELLQELPPSTRNPKEWLYMGKNLFALAQYQEAVESLNKVPEVATYYAEALWYKGLSLEGLGKAPEAQEVFLRLSKLNSEFKKEAEKKLK